MTLRIVSLVPSLTELLCSLGLKKFIVGCTKFCVHPADLHRGRFLLSGPKDADVRLIKDLKPSHVLVNEEENPPELINEIKKFCEVIETFPKSPVEVPHMIRGIAKILAVWNAGDLLAKQIEEKIRILKECKDNRIGSRQIKYLYFIWQNPYMLAGRDTYISSMLELAGFENASPLLERYPVIDILSLTSLAVDRCFFATEPWPFRKRDIEALEAQWAGLCSPMKIDGKLLSWYGSSTLECLEQLILVVQGRDSYLMNCF